MEITTDRIMAIISLTLASLVTTIAFVSLLMWARERWGYTFLISMTWLCLILFCLSYGIRWFLGLE